VGIVVPGNWKTVVGAFSELYHIPFAHPQAAGTLDEANTRLTLHGPHGIRAWRGAPSPALGAPMDDDDFLEEYVAFYGDEDAMRREFAQTSSFDKALAEVKRNKFSAAGWDMADRTDDDVLAAWLISLFPNVSLALELYQFMWRIRPNGTDPESSLL